MKSILEQDEIGEDVSLFHQHFEFFNRPIRLTEEQVQNPVSAIQNFFRDYHLVDAREMLWDWVVMALTSDNSHYEEPSARDSILHFYIQVEKLVEAAYLVAREDKKIKGRKK